MYHVCWVWHDGTGKMPMAASNTSFVTLKVQGYCEIVPSSMYIYNLQMVSYI